MDQVHYLGAFMTGLFRIDGLKTTQLGKILIYHHEKSFYLKK